MIIEMDLGLVNAYLVKENDNYMLVDTGGYLFADGKKLNNRRERLEEKLQAAGVTKENLKLLVLTHGDCDHSMNAAYIARTYHVPVAMHKADLRMVQAPDLELLMKTVNYRTFWWGTVIDWTSMVFQHGLSVSRDIHPAPLAL